jgi:hypothetical protein
VKRKFRSTTQVEWLFRIRLAIKKTLRKLESDIRQVYASLVWILLISAFFLGIVLGLYWWRGIPVGVLTSDPTSFMGYPFYVGFLSNLGILFWSGTAAICLFSARLISKRKTASPWGRYLYVSGFLTLLLTLDDLFILHEDVLPHYLYLPEHLVYGTYLGIVLIYIIRFRHVILETEYPLLGLALITLSLSVTFDIYPSLGGNPSLVHDGLKFIGIVSWLIYFTRLSNSALQNPEPLA